MANFQILVFSGVQAVQQPANDTLILTGPLDTVTHYVTATGTLILMPGGAGGIQSTNLRNARGNYALDLQIVTDANTQVASGYAAIILGGIRNTASGSGTTIIAGEDNVVTGPLSCIISCDVGSIDSASVRSLIGGGHDVTIINSDNVFVGAGENITCNASNSAFIGSGITCTITGSIAGVVCGGSNNDVTGTAGAICGGQSNSVSGSRAGILAGQGNSTAGDYAGICSGNSCEIAAAGDWAFIGGGLTNTVSGPYGFVGGGMNNDTLGSLSGIASGNANDIGSAGAHSFIGGGQLNTINNASCVIGGGSYNDVSATSSTIAGGYTNNANDSYSAVGGGQHNTCGGAGGVIGGGYYNILTQDGGTICGGFYNTVTASRGTVLGGEYNEVTKPYGVACGRYAKSHHAGSFALASGCLNIVGDAQLKLAVLRNTTSDATPDVLYLDGTTDKYVVTRNTTLGFTITVVGTKEGGTSSAVYKFEGGVRRPDSGNMVFVGTPVKTILGEDNVAYDASVVLDQTATTLDVQVTGVAATNMAWVARYDVTRVKLEV